MIKRTFGLGVFWYGPEVLASSSASLPRPALMSPACFRCMARTAPKAVPPTRLDQPTGGGADGLANIRGLAKVLPLSTPLEHYQVRSRFGPRCDPFNEKAACIPYRVGLRRSLYVAGLCPCARDRDPRRVSGCLRHGCRDRPWQRDCHPEQPHASLHCLGRPTRRGSHADRPSAARSPGVRRAHPPRSASRKVARVGAPSYRRTLNGPSR